MKNIKQLAFLFCLLISITASSNTITRQVGIIKNITMENDIKRLELVYTPTNQDMTLYGYCLAGTIKKYNGLEYNIQALQFIKNEVCSTKKELNIYKHDSFSGISFCSPSYDRRFTYDTILASVKTYEILVKIDERDYHDEKYEFSCND